jgi:catechol 2,3-dioxygenase-like lactoylglutathione lyase family enzyme
VECRPGGLVTLPRGPGFAVFSVLLFSWLAAPATGVQSPEARGPIVAGLDHIPIAVSDLEKASEQYKRLGFALKPGRPHANGIRNQHVKFPDGTELELIIAPEARDPLTTTYRRHLASGDGPAFLALFAPDRAGVPARLEAPLDYIFFGPRNASPTDRPEHFAHSNGADSLIAVWLSADDVAMERELFERLGARVSRREVQAPGRMTADVAQFQEGEVLLLPGSRQLVPGRRIVGATVRVGSIATVRQWLAAQKIPIASADQGNGSRIVVAPASTHGLWIEFRQGRATR